MPSKNWPTEVTACLLAYIDHNLALGREWNYGVVAAMKAQNFDRSNQAISTKCRFLEKLVMDGSTQSLAKDGSACLGLDDEMKAAVNAARTRFVGDVADTNASVSKHRDADGDDQEDELASRSARKRTRDDDDDQEVPSKRQKPSEAAKTRARKRRPACGSPAPRATRATRSASTKARAASTTEDMELQSARSKKGNGKARAAPMPTALQTDAIQRTDEAGPVQDNVHPTLQLLDDFYPQMRGLLFEQLENGSSASKARIADLESQLAAYQARIAALEAELAAAHGEIAELKTSNMSPPDNAEADLMSSQPEQTALDVTGEVSSPVAVPEVKSTETASASSGGDAAQFSPVTKSPQSEAASDADADVKMTDIFDADPLATPARPRKDFKDAFGVIYGQSPNTTVGDATQVQPSPPAKHPGGVSGKNPDEAQLLPEDDVDFGDETILG